MSGALPVEPSRNCRLCPRLAAYRRDNRAAHADWHNAPVPSLGSLKAELLVVGLAPGVGGANRTGRPFTGDGAGDLLYPSLIRFGLATGKFDRRPDDSLRLRNCRVTNAVRCVPPANRPVAAEIRACLRFLESEIAAMPRLRVALALGRVAHDCVLRALGEKPSQYKFGHGSSHQLDGLSLYASYHCSRYNTNTGRLTTEGFERVIAAICHELDSPPAAVP